jgi:hypothetical protein
MGGPINEPVGGRREVRICSMGEGAKSKAEGFEAISGQGVP